MSKQRAPAVAVSVAVTQTAEAAQSAVTCGRVQPNHAPVATQSIQQVGNTRVTPSLTVSEAMQVLTRPQLVGNAKVPPSLSVLEAMHALSRPIVARPSGATNPAHNKKTPTVNLNVKVINPRQKSQYETYLL